MLTPSDIRRVYPGRYPMNDTTLNMANKVMDELWDERNRERGRTTTDRSGSCKFAALLARDLFGGRLAGNLDHIFVSKSGVNSDGFLDLNRTQDDVRKLGDRAHIDDPTVLLFPEYRESLASCLPRVKRWVAVFELRAQEVGVECLPAQKRVHEHDHQGLAI